MATINAETSPDKNTTGTPFGGFDDARSQWATLQSATSGMRNSLLTLQRKLATLESGTEAIMQNYRDTEARNATTAAQIDTLLDQTTPTGANQTTPDAR